MVNKECLLKEVKEKAKLEAKARMLDEYDARDLVYEAEGIIEDFFGSITWEKVRDGFVLPIESAIEWHHRRDDEFEYDWKYLGLHRSGLQDAAERYLDRPWMQFGKMDWLILNTLTYAEYQGFVDILRRKTLSSEDYITLKVGRKKSFSSKMWTSLLFLLEPGIWLAIFCGLFLAWPPLALAYAAYSGWSVWKKRSAKKRISNLQQSISATYCTFSTISQSWAIVWDQLIKSRQDGVVWDGVVFRLVEERMNRFHDSPRLLNPNALD